MLKNILSYLTFPLLLLLSNSSGSSVLGSAQNVPEGFNPGPDAIAGNMAGLAVFGVVGTQNGVAIGLTTCNAGNQFINYFAIPDTRHPAVASNLYRMSGGTNNNDRFEQIGQSWVKHTFGAKQASACFSCQPGGDFTHLGVGCSDTYFASQSADQGLLGSRAWINPFTGVFPSNARDHTGHVHTAVSHMMLIESNDLNQTLNQNATYYAELLYVTPDEYAWCQGHTGECNMYNNSSYRQYSVSGTTNFTFAPVSATVRMTIPVNAWTGATSSPIEPVPGVDGRAFIAYKVTGPVAGVYHYEYAVYNQNLDRAIQSFSVPLGCGITVSNLGFHAPLNHPGFPNDGTQGDAGFSNVPWSSNQTATDVSWSTETFGQNQNANAVRWGTLYNFRFDSDHPPVATNATIGFFKTGMPVTVAIQGPGPCASTPSPTATATATATASPSSTATPTVSPSGTPTPTPSATASVSPTPAAQALNLSTRMLVQTGDNVGIGGFIITGTDPEQVIVRALGPSLIPFGVPNALADPILELHGPAGFATIISDSAQDSGCTFAPVSHPSGSSDELRPLKGGLCTFHGPENALEPCICTPLFSGAYTAVIRGKNNTTGVGLVEVYESGTSASKLANLSTRAFVSTGTDIVIAGFILGGNSGYDNVIVRGIGPSLTAFAVPNALANPQLELRNSSGTLIRSNNDWMDDAAQKALIIAAGLAPTNNLESAIAETLGPGQYTALLSGVNNGTGVGLVEVYDRGSQ